MTDQLEVVSCTSGCADELLEREQRSLATGLGHLDFASPYNLRVCVRGVVDGIA